MTPRRLTRPAPLAAASSVLLLILAAPLLADPVYSLPHGELLSSNIGFQVADFDGDAFGSPITLVVSNPEPLSMAFMASAFVGVVGWRVRRRRNAHAA